MTSQYNNLMPDMEMQSASLFHSIARVEVVISTDPKDKEVYEQGWSAATGKLYALSGIALSKLTNAAGIRRVHQEDYRTDDRSDPRICGWHWGGEYQQPDGTLLVLSGDYELDLRDYIYIGDRKIKGARFEEAFYAKRVGLLDGLAERKGISLPKGGDAKTAELDKLYRSLTEGEREEMDLTAEAQALRQIIQMRQHIVPRAQTGAMFRASRKLLQLKPQYTIEELKNPFVVYRSRFDYELMASKLGPVETQKLALIAASKALGVEVAELAKLMPPDSSPKETASIRTERTEEADAEKKESKPSTYLNGVLTYRIVTGEPGGNTVTEVEVNGKWKSALAYIESDTDAVRESVEKKVKSLFKDEHVPEIVQKNHLKKHFNGAVGPLKLTWEQLAALIMWKEQGKADKRWYGDKIESPTLDSPIDLHHRLLACGLIQPKNAGLVSKWIIDYNLPTPVSTDAKLVPILEKLCEAVEKGIYDPRTESDAEAMTADFEKAWKAIRE